MPAMGANNLSKYFGERLLFEGVTFELPDKGRAGLVGVNGCGKTTLMRILAGQEEKDGGNVYLSKDMRLGVMEQYASYQPERPLLEETMTVFQPLMDMETEMENVRRQIEAGQDDMDSLVLRQHDLSETYQQSGGLIYRARTESTLLGIGFNREDFSLPMQALSGGQKSKAQMAKLLLSGASILLLDEPTNHLDIASTEWLENHLMGYDGAILIISHDRYFLDKVTGLTFELENGKLTTYKGNYTRYQKLKAEMREQQERLYSNQQKEIHRVEGIIKEYRRWNKEKSVKRAESREKQLVKLKAASIPPEKQPPTIRFQLAAGSRGGEDVLAIRDLAKGFDKPLFAHLDMDIRKGDKAFLIGPNGIGKSTLFRIIMGEMQPDEGEILFGTGITPGYYDQAQAGLNEQNTVLHEIWNEFPQMDQTQVRNALAAFLFQGDDVNKPVSALSGGERARVALLKLMLSQANMLLLDEPTNHLDTPSREALEGALEQYDGSMIIISHDRYLINRLAQKVYAMDGEETKEYLGNYDDYVRKRDQLEEDADAQTVVKKAPAPQKDKPQKTDYQLRKERESNLRKLRSQIEKAEQRIEELESEIEQTETEMAKDEIASNYMKSMELAKEAEDKKVSLEITMKNWEKLHTQLEKLERQN